MKATLEKLWSEYLADKCSTIDTDEEKELAKIAADLHDKLNPSLTADQRLDVEKLIDTLCGMGSILAKKAFIKGCEFSVQFLLESGNLES